MAEAGREDALSRLSGRQVALFGVLVDGENAIAGKLELIVDGENVGGAHVPVNQALAVKEGQALQSGRENVASFRGSERALRKKLREIFLGVFHDDVEQFEIAEMAATRLEGAEQVRIGKFGGVLPAKQLEFGIRLIDLDELDGGFLRRSAAFGQKDSAVFRAAQILAK
jgi:hypothetical protein